MADMRPYGGTSLARLAKMINDDNATNLIPGVDYTLGPPLAYTDTEGRNTQVLLTPLVETDVKVPQNVHFWRLDLAVLGELPSGYVQPVVIDTVPFTIHQILPQLNQALGLDLEASEVVNTRYTVPQAAYALQIRNESSLAWTGSFGFQAQFPEPYIPLANVITETRLVGLEWLP